jgi:NAD(P)-dependent dehydrogenase (short-subunit alcohol dehydrogenase family)
MGASLQDRTVLVVSRGGGIARAIAMAARDAGASVVAAGRNQAALESAYDGLGITDEYVDLTDEASIDALGLRLGTVDHVVRGVRPDQQLPDRCHPGHRRRRTADLITSDAERGD